MELHNWHTFWRTRLIRQLTNVANDPCPVRRYWNWTFPVYAVSPFTYGNRYQTRRLVCVRTNIVELKKKNTERERKSCDFLQDGFHTADSVKWNYFKIFKTLCIRFWCRYHECSTLRSVFSFFDSNVVKNLPYIL